MESRFLRAIYLFESVCFLHKSNKYLHIDLHCLSYKYFSNDFLHHILANIHPFLISEPYLTVYHFHNIRQIGFFHIYHILYYNHCEYRF